MSGNIKKFGYTFLWIFRVKEMEMALEDIQEKLWELDKSWKNNLVTIWRDRILIKRCF